MSVHAGDDGRERAGVGGGGALDVQRIDDSALPNLAQHGLFVAEYDVRLVCDRPGDRDGSSLKRSN